MAKLWVADASPVIVRSKIGRIDLLSSLCQELVIPQSKAKEIQEGATMDNHSDGPNENLSRISFIQQP